MKRPLVLLTLCLFLPACSTVKLGWRFGPWLMEREAAEQLAWPDAERPRLKQAVHAWALQVGRVAAPDVAAQARSCAAAVEQGRDSDAAEAFFRGATAARQGLCRPIPGPLAGLLAWQPRDRARGLELAFGKQNAEDAKRWGDPDHSAVDQAKRLMATFKEFVGDPSQAQGDQLIAWAKDAAFPGTAYLAWRTGRQGALLAELRGPARPAAIEALLRDWSLDQSSQPASLKKDLENYRLRLRSHLKDVLAGLSPEQRGHLAARLKALAEDLEAIAIQANRAGS